MHLTAARLRQAVSPYRLSQRVCPPLVLPHRTRQRDGKHQIVVLVLALGGVRVVGRLGIDLHPHVQQLGGQRGRVRQSRRDLELLALQ